MIQKRTVFAALFSFVFVSSTSDAQIKNIPQDVIDKIAKAIPEKPPAKPKKPRKVLLFSKTNGFRHGSISVGVKSLTMLGAKTGAYTAIHSEDETMFAPKKLNEFDLVIMVNTTGEIFRPKKIPADKEKKQEALDREIALKQSLVDFVKKGKGLAGTHSATDTYKNWKEYNDMMGGAFDGHPWHMDVPVRILGGDHPLTKVFGGKGFTVKDEIYQFRPNTANPKDRRMLLSLAPDWDGLKRGKRKDNFYPISWIAKYGEGRTFYCSLGHRDEIYWNEDVLEHYLAGFQYAMGDLKADATPVDVNVTLKDKSLR
ncbi:MAG: ThuA domain-containing protein [Planctomycetota bacterium]|nr:ThuA domain-containing protein [Planctomycetota bacterium]